jgi:hypothetical protein
VSGGVVNPKPGDRFIHARFLADDAKPPYDTDESYREHVVTSTRKSGDDVIVLHTTAQAWDRGNHCGQWFFKLSAESESVRRWL